MKFFFKHVIVKVLITGLMSLIIVFIFIYLLLYKEKSINTTTIENDNKTLEMEDNNVENFTDIADLSNSEFKDMIDYSTNDLLYRNEPYYIYEGWNYSEEYMPSKSNNMLSDL